MFRRPAVQESQGPRVQRSKGPKVQRASDGGKKKFANRREPGSFGLQRGRIGHERLVRELLVPWLVAFALGAGATSAWAQSATAEVDVTAGGSSDEVAIASVQARLLAATKSDWRGYAEITWGATRSEYASDAFGAAYPYDGRARAMEVFGEKTFRPHGALLGLRAGRYRTPFGISGRSDYAYSGFLRAPLIRYGTNFALSNMFLETGAELLVGVPKLYLQTSLGAPADEGDARRRSGFDRVVRVQGYVKDAIVGVSYLHSQPSDRRSFVKGDMSFRGVDLRWMRGGVEMRGEWIDGQPFNTVTTRGGYLDGIVHVPAMGPVTAVARVERLDYDAGPFSMYLKRLTVGGRVRVRPWLVGQVNLVRQPGGLGEGRDHALDVAFTFTRRF